MPRQSARTGPFAPAAPEPGIWPAPLEPFNSLASLAAICLADASPPPAPDHRRGRGSVASKKPVGSVGLGYWTFAPTIASHCLVMVSLLAACSSSVGNTAAL